MKIKEFIYDNPFELAANCYLLIDEDNNCLIIDPGKRDKNIISFIKENELIPKGILLTHGHFDHIGMVNDLVDEFKIPFYISTLDKELLTNPSLNCSDRFSRNDIVIKSSPTFLMDKQIIDVLDEKIEVLATPYHTMGSVCFYLKDSQILFSGDSLFFESLGRSDFITSDPTLIPSSLGRILSLPKQVIVYPGHGQKTTIEHEIIENS